MPTLDGISLTFFVVSAILSFCGSIWFILAAFKKSIPWGLAVFFIPFASMAFLITNFDRAAKPFFLSLSSAVVVFIIYCVNPAFRATVEPQAQAKNQIAEATTVKAPATETKMIAPATKHSGHKHHHHHSEKK